MNGWQQYYLPSTVEEAVGLLERLGGQVRLVGGGTDLLVDYHRGKGAAALIDITRIPELGMIHREDDDCIIGAAVTHARIATSPEIQQAAPLLAQAAWQIGSPQVRNRGTLGGNLATASPSGDCLPPLAVLGAEVQIAGPSGRRWQRMEDFMLGVKTTILGPSELICAVRFRALSNQARSAFVKKGVRRGRSIAIASAAVMLEIEAGKIVNARVSLGAVSPRVQRYPDTEKAMVGEPIDSLNWKAVTDAASQECNPISDVRASERYRRHLAGVLVEQAVRSACENQAERFSTFQVRDGVMPFVLGQDRTTVTALPSNGAQPVNCVCFTLNGHEIALPVAPGSTLLQALRQQIALTGTKEGCAEGECGACTVLLDGLAVLACLTPAAAAHGRSVRTVESVAEGRGENLRLGAVQQALIDSGAVQCGYCTPGLVMSATALVESQAWVGAEAAGLRPLIREALSGNLCRCTGYTLIVDAVESVISQPEEVQP